MVERRQGNLLAVGLPCINSEILPRRNRAFSLSARLLECVAIQTHPYGRKYQALNSRDPTYGLGVDELRAIRPPPAPPGFDEFWRARYVRALGVDPQPQLSESGSQPSELARP